MKASGRLVLLTASVVLLVVTFEELQLGHGYVYFVNKYQKEEFRPINVSRGEQNVSIALVMLVARRSEHLNYKIALETVQCYAEHFNYGFYLINVLENATLVEKCPHKDFMFRRHCALSVMLPSIPYDWVLFLDADMAVVNPNHLVEQFLPKKPQAQIVFYDRIMNHEVMAGSYLLRNQQYARDFLMFWANYESKLPNSFHGTDNGAIHSVIVDFALPKLKEKREKCEEKYWKTSKNYADLSRYEVCMQRILKNNTIPEIVILPKGRHAWARDGWLTNSVWSDRDFIFHGWQKKRLDRRGFAVWHSPLVYNNPFNLTICKGPKAFLNWRYKDSFIAPVLDVDRELFWTIKKMENEFETIANSLS
ncbi:unnamed protein product [Caenorhabditis auriculariae]|uniref:Nucleotide-diphospho-sugar transferase domain-containing protein n=1 Tax=Caenorhabditis auriculariae TaxID=2777116 RepID=A0A8S1HNP0_9PELO|nr:unnamed protein product [Caenorhabditis auriculariae]